MSGTFFNVSGTDPTEGARVVFVWCRDNGSEEAILLATGHIAGADGSFLPPGVPIGQFSVTFPLPPRNSATEIVVTDDKGGKETPLDVTITPCLVFAGPQSGGTIAPSGLGAPVGVANPFPQHRQVVMARNAELES